MNRTAVQRRTAAGRVIESARKRQGWSQEVLASRLTQALGEDGTVTQSAVSFWETGRSMPQADKLPIIEKVLDLPPGSIGEQLYALRRGAPSEEDPAVLARLAALEARFGRFEEQIAELTTMAREAIEAARALLPAGRRQRAGAARQESVR